MGTHVRHAPVLSERHEQGEQGAVTAEAALGISLLILIAMGLAWMVCLGVVAVRAQDAARETARALARGEPEGEAVSLGQRVAGEGSSVTSQVDGRLVHVQIRSPVRGPGGVFAFIGSFTVSGEAVGLLESQE